MSFLDLRSDTVTKPCNEMRKIMAAAEVGDDVYGEDPTINRLEELAADIFQKEAALFVTSGTMGNQVAVLTHTSRGDEIILEAGSHINSFEVGGIAVMAGVLPQTIQGEKGKINPEKFKNALRPSNIHYPETTLLCLENTSNFGGGIVTTAEEMNALASIAKEKGITIHVDGARIFNASIYLNTPVSKLTRTADSVMFCLSKGLGAPIGSMLVGSKDFICRARKYRKMLGGGLRQAGILAAAGIYALENLVERLAEDHANARRLAEGLAEIPGFNVDLNNVQTNILMVDLDKNLNAYKLVELLRENGVLINARDENKIRFVTHRNISTKDVDEALKIINNLKI